VTIVDREQLKRDCAEALSAIQRDKGVIGLAALADRLVALGASYRFHGVRLRQSLRQHDEGAIIADMIQVLDKLERDVT
jgi:hypothetical protein